MNKEFAYLIAECLYLNTASEPLCNRNWLFAIFKALLIENEGSSKSNIWTKHNQWKIDHNCRAAKSKSKKNKTEIISINITNVNKESVKISAIFKRNGSITKTINCNYKITSFPIEMWEEKNQLKQSVLLSKYERDKLFYSSIQNNPEIFEQAENSLLNEVEINSNLPCKSTPKSSSNKTKKSKSSLYNEEIRDMKFTALNLLLNNIREEYYKIKDPSQKSFLEVVIGAAIFYLPSLNIHFNGFISINALKGFLKKEWRVKDHIYPRKLAAKKLLSHELNLNELKELYQNKLAHFMYVTSTENSNLINYYEEYENHDQAMVALQIEKFPINEKEKFISHNELNKFLIYIDDKNIQDKNIKELMKLLEEFRIQN